MNRFRNIGIIGEGKMGTSIFLFLNGFDFRLTWVCSNNKAADRATKLFRKKTGHLMNSGLISGPEHSLKMNRTRISASLDDIKECDLVIEAITESLELKRELFAEIETVVKPDCILVSNSSSVLTSVLIPACGIRERYAGLHFFFPVQLKNTVELISSKYTSSGTRNSLIDFLLSVNKTPFCQDESNPFILNRMILGMQAEAFKILSENEISFAEIDKIVKEELLPLGIFEFFDHVGIDVMLASVESYSHFEPDRAEYLPMISALMEKAGENRLGIKTGEGFYRYDGSVIRPPEENQVPPPDKILQQKILKRLYEKYGSSVTTLSASGICSKEDLVRYLQDYLGTDRDPFKLTGP